MEIVVRYHLHKTCSDMKNYGIFLLVIICIMSCKPTKLPPEPKEGDEWAYRVFDYDETGNIVDSTDVYFIGETDNHQTSNTIEPYAHIHVPGNYYSYALIPAGEFRMESDGLYCLTFTSGAGGKGKILFLKYPGIVGDSFMMNAGNYSEGRNITSINDSISVPYGNLTGLYKYEFFYMGSPKGKLWFNENVWFAKYEKLDSLTSGTGVYVDYAYELVSYTPH
jgi:hypothetical protein